MYSRFDNDRYTRDYNQYVKLIKSVIKEKHISRQQAEVVLADGLYPVFEPNPHDYYHILHVGEGASHDEP